MATDPQTIIDQIDIERFNDRALELVAPHVTQAQGIIRHPLNGRTTIYMGVKTHRCAMDGGDFDAQGSSPMLCTTNGRSPSDERRATTMPM